MCGCACTLQQTSTPSKAATARAFGWRLYRKFFKTYTEKIWGMPATRIKADWAAQRIKSLTLGKAIRNALAPGYRQTRVTSLIDEFHYPRLGPGMMWERASELVEAQGSKVLLGTRLESIRRFGGRGVEAVDAGRSPGPDRCPRPRARSDASNHCLAL